MTAFMAGWLALREPFDLAGRAAAWPAIAAVCDDLCIRATQRAQPRLAVIDLACGIGANVRALAPRIGGWQQWQLIDHDPALLAEVPNAMARWAMACGYQFQADSGPQGALRIDGPALRLEVVSSCVDLARNCDAIAFGQADLVTASALLDLVSAQWVDALVDRVRASGAAWLWPLNVDGRIDWDPVDKDDPLVHQLFDLHQRRDKGFGLALGPNAVPHLRQRLAAADSTVLQARSDWIIDGAQGGTGAPAMLAAMIAGMADAAIEQRPDATDVVRAWQARRMAGAQHTRLMVGHLDVAGFP
jgi:hypothetical protein